MASQPSCRSQAETLYWPRHPVGLAGSGRHSADAWMVDLLRHGVDLDARVAFTIEDVLFRFKLCIHKDGSFRTDPIAILPWVGATFVTDEGDTAPSLDHLIVSCVDGAPEWRYPLEYQCRIVHARDPQHYRVTHTGLEPVGAGRGRNNRNRMV